MNEIFEKIEITEANIEEMSRLAEDVMHQLRYQAYGEDSNAGLLENLFCRGDDIGYVRGYSKEDIIPWIEPIIPKALNLFRKGTGGDTNFTVGKSVPDDYLIAAFAREVRNMMMIFAGQKLQREQISRYLLLLEAESCHDGDEWRGIYFDDENLRKAYGQVSAELEERKKNDAYYRSFKVGIWEFRPMMDGDISGERQKICRVIPEELRCFKEKSKQ